MVDESQRAPGGEPRREPPGRPTRDEGNEASALLLLPLLLSGTVVASSSLASEVRGEKALWLIEVA